MSSHRIADRVFGAISAAVLRRPWLVVCTYLVLLAIAGIVSWRGLEVHTDQNELISSDLPYNLRYQEFLNNFGDLEFLYIAIQVDGNPSRAAQVADALAEEARSLTEHVQRVYHRISPESFRAAPVLLSPLPEVENLVARAGEQVELLRQLRLPRTISRFLDAFSHALETPAEDGGQFAEHAFRLLELILDGLGSAARGSAPPPLVAGFKDALTRSTTDPRRQGYMFSENGKLAFVLVLPRKDFATLEVISEPLRAIRGAIDKVRARFPGVEIGLTGRPVLQADEMATTNRDMTISTILAAVLVFGLTVFFFRRIRRPLLAVLTLLVAVGLTFGLVTITIGYLTLLSIVFAVMMIGLGCDFGMLYLARYQEELLASADVDTATHSTLLSAGLGIWTGGVTTSCTFFSAMFVHFKGLAELGFVAGMGLLVCLATMVTLLPALVVITDRHIQRRRRLHPPRPIEIPILELSARFPRLTLLCLGSATLVGFWGFRGVRYNANLLDLQVQELESVRYEKLIPELSGLSTWYACFMSDSLEEVDRILGGLRPLREKGVVSAVESVRDFLPVDQDAKLALLSKLRTLIEDRPAESTEPDAFNAPALRSSLEQLLDRLDHLQSLAARSTSPRAREAVQALQRPMTQVEETLTALEKASPETIKVLEAHEKSWRGEVLALWKEAESFLFPARLEPSSLPEEIRSRFLSKDGRRFLVYAYPARDIWAEDNMEEFITSVRSVDPQVTGAPVTTYESTNIMREGFVRAGIYSLIMVFLFLLLDFRNLRYTLLTMVPVLVGLLWAFQLMPRLGLDLNLANFFALPILLGCAVDGCVHMLHRVRECGSVAEAGRTTGAAVCLAALSNLFGFLSMGIAQHRGIASLGFVTALGCGTILVASVIFLPGLLALLERRKPLRVTRDAGPPPDQAAKP